MKNIRPAAQSISHQASHPIEYLDFLKATIAEIKQAGTYKKERIITSPQGMEITAEGKRVLNFCANNYLGFADNKKVGVENACKVPARS